MLKIDLTTPGERVLSGHLKMGGTNPQGIEINANSRHLTMDGKPWMPVMGEIHFSRVPHECWKEELLKMKAGGITVAATYLFWIHHEEIEGEWDWSDNRDVGRFARTCAECGLSLYPRIGPWAHGEARNGGFPDWILKKGFPVRRDDPDYLEYVRKWYGQISNQLKGLLWKDGGPIVGIQLENELPADAQHLLTLKGIAREAGLDVPLYTVTGWDGAKIPQDEVIPLSGGYPDEFWNGDVTGWARASRINYLFGNIRGGALLADIQQSDHEVGDDLSRYPCGTCETGGGMQVSYHRRPAIEPGDVAALSLVKLGSGSNLPGYYMYAGGSHPLGKLSTMQESQETGYPNDMPAISYDFQAPIREFGQLSPSYHALRAMHLFLGDFGDDLAAMPVSMPDLLPKDMDDTSTLRWTLRSNGRSGFIFINNYLRVESLPEKDNVQLALKLESETLTVPSQPVQIPRDRYMIWPFNLNMNGSLLKHATAQLICEVDDSDGVPCYVFFTPKDMSAEFAFDSGTVANVDGALGSRVQNGDSIILSGFEPGTGCVFTLTSADGKTSKVMLLKESQALTCWKAEIWGKERLFLSSSGLIFNGDALRIQDRRTDMSFSVFPAPECTLGTGEKDLDCVQDGMFFRYSASVETRNVHIEQRLVKEAEPARIVKIGPAGRPQAPDDADFEAAAEWLVKVPSDALDGVHDLFLCIDYAGDVGRAYLGDRLISDDFYFGRTWEIGLRRFARDVLEQGLTIKILPLRKDAPVYIPKERLPDFKTDGEAMELRDIRAVPLYEVNVTQTSCPSPKDG